MTKCSEKCFPKAVNKQINILFLQIKVIFFLYFIVGFKLTFQGSILRCLDFSAFVDRNYFGLRSNVNYPSDGDVTVRFSVDNKKTKDTHCTHLWHAREPPKCPLSVVAHQLASGFVLCFSSPCPFSNLPSTLPKNGHPSPTMLKACIRPYFFKKVAFQVQDLENNQLQE